MLRKTSRSDAVKDKASDLISAASDAVDDVAGTVKEKVSPVVDDLAEKLDSAKGSAADAAAPRAKKVKAAAAPHLERAQQAGLTRDQAQGLFSEEWMPRIQQAIAAAAASGQQAYAALPAQARDTVEHIAPAVAKKKKKKRGRLLIALGLLAGAGAVAFVVSGKKNGTAASGGVVEVERIDITAVDESDSADLVGDVETQVDATLTGDDRPAGTDKPRGRHAARD